MKVFDIILALIVGAVAFIIINYFTGWVDTSPITSPISSTINDFSTKFTSDPLTTGLTLIAGAAPVATVGKLAYDALKKEAETTITNQSNVIVDKQTELQAVQSSYEQKIADMQTEIDSLKNMPNDALALQETIAQKEKQITNIQGGQDAILKLHDTFVKDLMSKAGNQTIVDPVTQKTYWVIEKPPIIKVL